MPDTSASPPRVIERLIWVAAVVVVAAFLTCLHLAGNTPYKLTTFEQLVNFDAAEPFQHRVLLPAAVAALQYFLPLGEKLLFGVFEMLGWITLILLAYRALMIFNVTRSPRLRAVLALTVVIPMLAHLMIPDLLATPVFVIVDGAIRLGEWEARPLFYYIYDLPAALLTLAMTLVLVCHARAPATRYLVAYFLLFTLATVNRETSAFMMGVFALLFFRSMAWPRFFVLIGLQCVVFVAIQWSLGWLFAGNINPNAQLVGTQYENHIRLNLRILSEPAFLITFLARFAAGLYLPVLLWHRALDRRLAIALVGFGLPLVFFAMLGGIIREYRIFIEIVPLIWLAAMQVIAARAHTL